MDSPSPPATPDPIATAQAQGTANADAARLTTRLNRANQITPYGSQTWSSGPAQRTFNQKRYDDAVAAARMSASGMAGAGQGSMATVGADGSENGGSTGGMGAWAGNPALGDKFAQAQASTVNPNQFQMPDRNADEFYDMQPGDDWTSTITLDPRVQALMDSQLATSQGLEGATQSALGRVQETFSQAAPTPDSAMRQRVEDAIYQRYAGRLNPRFAEEENSMKTTLMNRGLTEGSQAWDAAMSNFGRTKNDAYSTATQDAVRFGGDEMRKQYDMSMAGRQAVLNELNALRSGQQVSTPQFGGTPSGANVNAAPVAQSIFNSHQAEMGNYNAGVAENNSMMGGLASVASMAAMAF
jgi:hypothetical protein